MTEDATYNLPMNPEDFEKLYALANLTHHSGPSAMAKRLLELTLVERTTEISIPDQPDALSEPRNRVFARLGGNVLEVVQDGAASHQIAPQRFALYTVQHALVTASQEISLIDTMMTARMSFLSNLTRQQAQYLPG